MASLGSKQQRTNTSHRLQVHISALFDKLLNDVKVLGRGAHRIEQRGALLLISMVHKRIQFENIAD